MSDAALQDIQQAVGDERDFIATISTAPGHRRSFVAAAEYFDNIGDVETASSLHKSAPAI